jgi:hypothetical protein
MIRKRISTFRGVPNVTEQVSDAVASVQVDKDAGIIRGASAMQAVEALGHGVLIDQTTLEQVRDLGNAASGGIKVRFTHPGLCSDGMGKLLGRQKDFRLVGDKVVGDIHMLDAAAKSPDGDLRAYVLDLAAEDPASFGMSVVVSDYAVWKLVDGTEVRTDDASLRRGDGEDSYFAKPVESVSDLPFLRVDELHACDVVDEPAANRGGLFAEAFNGTTSLDAAQAFAFLDATRERFGFGAADLRKFLDTYLSTRGIAASTQAAAAAEKESRMDVKTLAALSVKHPAHAGLILSLAAADDATVESITECIVEADRKAELDSLNASLAAKDADLKACADEIESLKAEVAKFRELAAIAKGAAKDPGTGTAEGKVLSRSAMGRKAKADFIKEHGKDAFLALPE